MPEPTVRALRLRLWGDAALLLPDGRAVVLERRAAALLALAALEPGISRLRVAALLWPDSGDPRRNLRQQMLRFRAAFERDLVVGAEALSLAPDLTLEPDAPRGKAPLLGQLAFEDCEDFAGWLLQQRQTRQRGAQDALRRQLAEGEAAGDLDAALQAAHELLALDDQQESHHRELMRLHYLRGDHAAGLAAHKRLGEMLATDHGSQPSPASQALAEALRANLQQQQGARATPGGLAARQSLAVTLTRPPLLVGREPERAAVLGHWAAGRAVLLQGEAGLGKSRLMAEMLAGDGAALMAAGRPGDAGAPYATLTRLLRPLLAQGVADLSTAARDALAHIAPATAVPATSASAPNAEAAERPLLAALRAGAMASAVSELLQARSRRLIALDDLHFADGATLDLMANLIASQPASPLAGPPASQAAGLTTGLTTRLTTGLTTYLTAIPTAIPTPIQSAIDEPPRHWLLATRPAELGTAAQALCGSLTELQRLGVVPLAALDETAIAAIVDAIRIDGLHGRHLAAPLWRHTGGNPLFVLETLKQGLADGSLARGELPHPQGVGRLIERRLQQLSEPALVLARVAAIAGVDFSIELAESAIGVRAVQLASAWGELQDAQVLRDETFAHDLVWDAVLRGVPPVVARRVHAQCAQWLAAAGVEPARVAQHWLNGGLPAQAGRAFVAAAERANLAARTQESAALWAQAAQAFDAAGMADQRFEALCHRGSALVAAQFGEQALHELRALLASAGSAAQRLRATRTLVGLLTERGESAEALQVGMAALPLARQHGDHEITLRLSCNLVSALCRLGRAAEALALLLPLRPWVQSQNDAELRMLWHGDWAATLGNLGRLNEAVAAFDEARAAARQTGHPDYEGRLMMNCAVTLRQGGQLDRAVALSRQGRALSLGDPGDASHLLIANLVLARDDCETGGYAAALSALEDTLPQFVATDTHFWAQACRLVLVQLWQHLGQPARAVPLLRDEPQGLPAWLRADRLLLRLDLAQVLRQPAPAGSLQAALALADSDAQRGLGLRVRALRHLPPEQVLDAAGPMATQLAALERRGISAALHAQRVSTLMQLGRQAAAADEAQALLALMDDGIAPDSMYRAQAWWLAHQALAGAGRHELARHALEQGTRWVTQTALPQVPAAFIDSFLQRNPVNRQLLLAARWATGETPPV